MEAYLSASIEEMLMWAYTDCFLGKKNCQDIKKDFKKMIAIKSQESVVLTAKNSCRFITEKQNIVKQQPRCWKLSFPTVLTYMSCDKRWPESPSPCSSGRWG